MLPKPTRKIKSNLPSTTSPVQKRSLSSLASRVVAGAAANHGRFSMEGVRRGGEEERRGVPSLLNKEEKYWSLIFLFSEKNHC